LAEHLQQFVVVNFRSNKPVVESTEPPAPSKAQALGVPKPLMSAEQKTGALANAQAAARVFQAKIQKQAQFQRERAEFEKAREDALWSKILERQRNAV
jgi:hypothetical protein